MVYTFRMVSDEADDFMREVRIDADASFLDLRNIVCQAAGFDTGGEAQMQSFFTCEDGWEKEREIALCDLGQDPGEEVALMEETRLSDLIDDEGQRLIFTFDYLNDRNLFMELKVAEPGVRLKEAVVTRSRGEAPQLTVDIDPIADLRAELEKAKKGAKDNAPDPFDDDDMDADFYGSDGYNDDEIQDLVDLPDDPSYM